VGRGGEYKGRLALKRPQDGNPPRLPLQHDAPLPAHATLDPPYAYPQRSPQSPSRRHPPHCCLTHRPTDQPSSNLTRVPPTPPTTQSFFAKEKSVLLDAMPDVLEVASTCNTFHSHCLCCYMLKRFDVLILISMFVMFSCLVLRTIYYAQTIVEGKERAATTYRTI
jgi:hypothetical protein